jgi:hypothetical protein
LGLGKRQSAKSNAPLKSDAAIQCPKAFIDEDQLLIALESR